MRSQKMASRALTLIELIVVLIVLTIVAGVLVNKAPNLINRANNVSWQTNATEIDRVMVQYHAFTRGQYPDGFDSLVDSTGGLYTGLPGGAAGGLSTNVLEARAPTATELSRLNKAGITTVQQMKDDPTGGFGATYFAYTAGPGGYTNEVIITDTTPICFLKANSGTYQFAGQKYRLNADHTYAVFGVGQGSSLVGPDGWIKEAPVVVHLDGCQDPAVTYGRVGILIDCGLVTGGSPFSAAKYVGSVVFAPNGFKYTQEMINIADRLE